MSGVGIFFCRLASVQKSADNSSSAGPGLFQPAAFSTPPAAELALCQSADRPDRLIFLGLSVELSGEKGKNGRKLGTFMIQLQKVKQPFRNHVSLVK